MRDLFEALSTPARPAIVEELSERDGQLLFELCARQTMKHKLTLTRQTISQHLETGELWFASSKPRLDYTRFRLFKAMHLKS